ncbi:MAG: hypothetical protein M2R46_05162 [Verrucomicrobia subdivision 3 bacterium]|nr:hypothetical protein [Limisphaerales bacterium]
MMMAMSGVFGLLILAPLVFGASSVFSAFGVLCVVLSSSAQSNRVGWQWRRDTAMNLLDLETQITESVRRQPFGINGNTFGYSFSLWNGPGENALVWFETLSPICGLKHDTHRLKTS